MFILVTLLLLLHDYKVSLSGDPSTLLRMTGKPVSQVRVLRLFLVESKWHCNIKSKLLITSAAHEQAKSILSRRHYCA